MELVVHGTKGGYRSSLIPYVTPSFALGDIGNGVNNESPLGESVYSIAFVNGGCVFTKYTIVRDTLRYYATGTIAFSLFLPAGKELQGKGADIISLLDGLSDRYTEDYIKDNNINRGETDIIQENWGDIFKIDAGNTLTIYKQDKTKEDEEFQSGIKDEDNILKIYKEQIKAEEDEELQSETKDAAFVYYPYDYEDQYTEKTTFELKDIFDNPFQKEYCDYRQVLFINNNDEPADPLSVLKHSDVRLKINLKNESYYLSNFDHSKSVSITANDKPRNNENKCIRAKWTVKIYYLKDERCYFPIEAKGELFKPNSEIFKYLEIKDDRIYIKYDAFNNPSPKSHKVIFEIRDYKGNPITKAKIFCKNKFSQNKKDVVGNTITFDGKEIIEEWTLWAKVDDNLYSEEVHITPYNHDINTAKTLILKEHKKVKFQGEYKNKNGIQYYSNTKITIREKNIENVFNHEVDFINGEIGERYKVVATYQKGNEYLIGKKKFRPKDYANNGTVLIELTKQESRLNIGTGKNNESKFKNFTKLAIIAGLILTVATLGFCIRILHSYLGTGKLILSQITKGQIEKYVEGDTLFLNTLNNYKTDWEKQKPIIERKDGDIFGLFGIKKQQIDSTKYKEWEEVLQWINRAIDKRNLINSANFAELKKQRYSDSQLTFKNTISTIDSSKYEDVKKQLADVSKLTLPQVADSINAIILKTKEKAKEQSQEQKVEKETKQESKAKLQENKQSPAQASEKNSNQTIPEQTPIMDKTSEITQYLKGSEIKKEGLEAYKTQTQNINLKRSIDLALKFWKLDGSKNNSYSSYQQELKNDNNLANSDLKDFVDTMIIYKPKYVKELPESDQKRTLAHLKNKLK